MNIRFWNHSQLNNTLPLLSSDLPISTQDPHKVTPNPLRTTPPPLRDLVQLPLKQKRKLRPRNVKQHVQGNMVRSSAGTVTKGFLTPKSPVFFLQESANQPL